MDRQIIVFGTTAIVAHEPAYEGQAPVYVNRCPHHGYEAWSTGKLERALAMEADVYVCTVLPRFRPEDAWWRELVPAERIYKPVTDARGTMAQAFDHFINAPWRRLLRDLGKPWPANAKDALEWRLTLDGSRRAHGILYGGHLQGAVSAS